MKYSSKAIRILLRLRNGEEVNEGEVRSKALLELVKELEARQAVAFVRRGRSRGAWSAVTPERLTDACGEIDPVLSNLDSTLLLAEGKVSSRAEKVELFGNSKQDGADKTVRGFTILADRNVTVQYLGREFPLAPLAGLHVIDRNSLAIPEEATVFIVENAECLYDLRWIQNVGLRTDDGPFIILCRFPICEEAKRWLEGITNRILYFGDFDLAGIRIYEAEFKRRLGEKISFIIPDDLEKRLRQNGNPILYSKQLNNGFSSVSSPSGELNRLIAMLHRMQSAYEQEGFCNSHHPNHIH